MTTRPLGRRVGRRAGGDAASGASGEAALDLGRQPVVVQISGGRHDEVPCAVVGIEEPADLRGVEGRDAGRRTEHFAAERVVGEEGARALLGGEIGGLVGMHEDLVQDHLALGLDVVGTQRRVRHDGAEDVEPEREILREQADVEGGVLLGGEGVHVTTDLVDRLSDIGGAPRRRALEEQMLQKMRRAGAPFVLVGEPVPTQTPTVTDRTSAIGSVTSRIPLSSTSLRITSHPAGGRTA